MKIPSTICILFFLLLGGFFPVVLIAETLTFSFDSINRVTRIDYADGTSISYAYDAAGNRLSLVTQIAPPGDVRPVIQITQPTTNRVYVTTASSISLSGTASDPSGISTVSIASDIGFESDIIGTTSWASGSIPLSNGVNRLTITAANQSGITAEDTLVVVVLSAHAVGLTLFEDDFNENVIDPEKWTHSGNTVLVANQTMNVLTTVTDAGGILQSVPIPINRSGLITISRAVRLHYANSYYVGRFRVAPGDLSPFGVYYANMSWNSPANNASSCYGIYLGRYGANPHTGERREIDTTGPISGIWNIWFDEKMTYDPETGILDYYVNNAHQMTYDVGPLPTNGPANMVLSAQAWGWWTGHEQLFDNLLVMQADDTSLMERDTDGDGMPDWQELLAGTSISDPDSRLELVTQRPQVNFDEGFPIEWSSVAGIYYNVLRATNLVERPAFAPIQLRVPGQPETTVYIDTNAPPAGPSFYQITVDY